jgi:PEP-CTERM motif-containing protein
MRLHKVITMIAMVVVVALPAAASTAPLLTPNAGEEDVYEIFNYLYGTSYTSNIDLDSVRIPNYEVFSIPAGETLNVEARVRYAGVLSEFGWYEPILPGDPVNYSALFSVAQTGYVTGVSASVDFDSSFGFYLDPAGDGAVWHSETARNWLGEDHMVAYLTPNDSVLLCWEDLPLVGGGGEIRTSDSDYNDLLVELKFGVVPEPTSMLLLGLGIAGMVVRRFRTFA